MDIIKAFSCSAVQSTGSGPLVASDRSLNISLNPGIQILQIPVMPKKIQSFLFFFFNISGVLTPNITYFLFRDYCVLSGSMSQILTLLL